LLGVRYKPRKEKIVGSRKMGILKEKGGDCK
jgi:hypothetical protein